MRRAALVAVTAVLAVQAGFVPAAGARLTGCGYPAQVLDLSNWKLTLPTGVSGSPDTIPPRALATYSNSPFFKVVSRCSGVQFRASVDGVTTRGSRYPRTELREMTNNGTANASWSSTTGTHTMVLRQAITDLPAVKPHVVAGQIHDALDDIATFRLEGTKLYITDGNVDRHKLVTSDYRLWTVFEAKFEVSAGEIRVYYNGVLQTTIVKDFTGGFFKAGAYPQANCSNSAPCDSTNFGQVVVYGLTVTHS